MRVHGSVILALQPNVHDLGLGRHRRRPMRELVGRAERIVGAVDEQRRDRGWPPGGRRATAPAARVDAAGADRPEPARLAGAFWPSTPANHGAHAPAHRAPTNHPRLVRGKRRRASRGSTRSAPGPGRGPCALQCGTGSRPGRAQRCHRPLDRQQRGLVAVGSGARVQRIVVTGTTASHVRRAPCGWRAWRSAGCVPRR